MIHKELVLVANSELSSYPTCECYQWNLFLNQFIPSLASIQYSSSQNFWCHRLKNPKNPSNSQLHISIWSEFPVESTRFLVILSIWSLRIQGTVSWVFEATYGQTGKSMGKEVEVSRFHGGFCLGSFYMGCWCWFSRDSLQILSKGEPMGFNGGLMGIWQSCKQTMGLLWTISKILSDKQPMGLIDDNHGLFVQTIVVCHEITCFKDHCILCTISKLLVPFFSSNTTDWHFLNWHYYLFGPIFFEQTKAGALVYPQQSEVGNPMSKPSQDGHFYGRYTIPKWSVYGSQGFPQYSNVRKWEKHLGSLTDCFSQHRLPMV
jgi:hypothetical protein